MFLKKLDVSERAREIIYWFTIGMIALVALIALVTILQACSRIISQAKPPLEISPAEARLCTGEQILFTVTGSSEVTWEATGGDISQSGLHTAGQQTGEFVVTASDRGSSRSAQVIVRVVECTPTPDMAASPTPPPAATATPQVGSFTTADARGDVGLYDTGAPVQEIPAGIDIRSASVRADLRVGLEPGEGVPSEFADWVEEGEVVFWIALYEPIPDPPGANTDWLFALDLDGDTTTGRPPGERRINPDLGDEAVIQVSYRLSTGSYTPYLYVWNPSEGSFTDLSGPVRFEIDRSRTLIGIAVDLQALSEAVEQTTGVVLDPDQATGRGAAVAYLDQTLIDFSPDLPE
jgi:hypothetical protein